MNPATLTGLAVGDALGMPFETHHFLSKALLDWDGTFQSGATNTLQPDLKPGQWTDDTQMATALALSLVACETYDPIGATQAYMEWATSGLTRGMGKTTEAAFQRVIRGYHWMDSGVVGAEGNGTAMRIAPLGLFYRHSPSTAALASRIDANITHRSAEASDGAAAVAVAVALLCNGVSKIDLIQKTLYYVGFDTKVTEKLCDVRDFFRDLPEVEQGKAVFNQLLEMGTGAHIVETVPAAFLCFLTTDTFSEAVELAVRAGGDTDTTAAITGALAGTFYGVGQVAPYLMTLEDGSKLRHLEATLYEQAPEIPKD